jgi:formamidopyrimidine-DNA glycosylase
VGQRLEVETPHPRAAVKQLAPRLDGRRLENVEAIGKNLLLRFEGGLVLRSHLRMKGRWRVFRRDTPIFGQPWLVLRGDDYVGGGRVSPRGDSSCRSPTRSCARRSRRRIAS